MFPMFTIDSNKQFQFCKTTTKKQLRWNVDRFFTQFVRNSASQIVYIILLKIVR